MSNKNKPQLKVICLAIKYLVRKIPSVVGKILLLLLQREKPLNLNLCGRASALVFFAMRHFEGVWVCCEIYEWFRHVEIEYGGNEAKFISLVFIF